jgi:hypothetical protein
VGKPDENRQFGRSRHRWEDNIKMDIKEMRWKGVDSPDLVQDGDKWWAVVSEATKHHVRYNTEGLLGSSGGLLCM